MSLNFFWEIIGKISIILISIYLLTQHKWFYYLFASLNSNYLKIYYNTIFIILGLAGLLLSTNLNGFIINNIHLSIVLSGLLGGLDSALITTFALDIIIFIFNFNHPPLGIIISTSILGIFCGFYNKIYDVKRTEIKKILPIIVVTFLLQILTNLIRLKVTSFSITQIWTLLYKEILAIIINIASGTYITLKIIKNTFNSYQNMEALHAHDTLKIADKTLPYLRTGLNPETALMTVKLIMDITDVEAVAITDKEKVLAFEGIGSDHHKSGAYILTSSTRNVLKKGHAYIISNKKDIGCPVEDCPLVSAVVAPLKCKNEVVGTLKLYQSRQKEINPSKVSLAMGLANLLSIQMELSEVGKLEKLTVQAELRALQAQINPHFLFNTLNTIASFSRTQPDEARQLLIKFADFFRKNLQQHSNFITLREEIEYIDTYLVFEKARFGDRLIIKKDIESNTLNITIPVLILQPIIENAIQHGVSQKIEGGCVEIISKMQKDFIKIIIKDNGIGIPPGELKKILTPGYGKGMGVGLSNINDRLKIIYGKEFQVKIFSVLEKGTEVHLQIPLVSISYQMEAFGKKMKV